MNVIVIGCGRVGAQVAAIMAQDGHNVTLIDKNADAFKRLGLNFNGRTVTGNGFDEALLREFGAEKADAFVAVTSGDNTNLMACQIAKKIFNIKKVIARVYDPRRADLYTRFGLDTISGTTIIANMIKDDILKG